MIDKITLENAGVNYISPSFNIELLRADVFKCDHDLIENLMAILAPSYKDPSMVLQREITHCTHLYLGKSNDEMVCFFLLSWESINFPNGNCLPAVYMGLSATRQDKKNSGIVRRAYLRALNDVSDWEKKFNKRVIAWATMATPTSYLFSRALLSNVQPSPDGSFSLEGAEIASAIRQQQGYGRAINHQFVLHAVADNTLYSEAELCRIERVLKRKHFHLFEQLDIQEKRGDRLLIIGEMREGQSIPAKKSNHEE